MAQKTNTTKNESIEMAMEMVQTSNMSQDLKTAVLIVSVVANLFFFTGWVALQVTTQYDMQIATLLFNR
jgi:hypothetical protein